MPQGRIRTQSQTLQASTIDSNSTSNTASTSVNQQQIPETPISAPSILTTTPVPITPSIFTTQNQPMLPERKRGSLKANIKQTKRRLGGTSTKDLGRFKPTDDLALVINIQQTNDIKTVHRGTKFSCKFTIQELSNRWYSLMYDESISRIAISAMRNLHPEMISSI